MIKNFIFDVDGVFTDGKFYYSESGKIMKIFGDADNDALSILNNYVHIEMVTGDKRGFAISRKRITEDMGYDLSLVSTFKRVNWLEKRFNLDETIYMGDGIYDPLVFQKVQYVPKMDSPTLNNLLTLLQTQKDPKELLLKQLFMFWKSFLT